MRHQITKLLFLFFLLACHSSIIPPHIVRYIDEEDNNLCNVEGVPFETNRNYLYNNEVYWRCRLRIINQRINGEFDPYGYSKLYRKEFEKMKYIIQNRLKEEQIQILDDIKNYKTEKEYNYCLSFREYIKENGLVYEDEIIKAPNIKCKEILAGGMYDANGKDKYLSNEQLLERYLDEDYELEAMVKYEEIKKECIKYAVNKEQLEYCMNSIKEIQNCENETLDELILRRRNDKVFCMKSTSEQYPDSLANFDSTTASSMMGPKMNKIDLIEIRNKAYLKCLENRTIKISDYQEYLTNECKKKSLAILERKDKI